MEPTNLGSRVVQRAEESRRLYLNWVEDILGERVRNACQMIFNDPKQSSLQDDEVVELARQFVRGEQGEEIGVLDDVPFTSE